MKRIISILLSVTICLSVAACNDQIRTNDPNPGPGKPPTEQQTPQPASDENKDVLNGEVTGEISVSCYDTMIYKAYLEDAAIAFEEKYPGTKVNIDAVSKMPEIKTSETAKGTVKIMTKGDDDGLEKEDYINKINTELMSGKGADILAMDVVPYYKYAQGGQLIDLNDYINADDSFHKSDYKENIMNGLQYIGGQYSFPIDYFFDYIAYDSSLFTDSEKKPLLDNDTFTYEQLIEMGQKPFAFANSTSNEPVEMFGLAPRDMYEKLWRENYKNFIDIETKTANLNNGEFAKLLDTVMAYSENGYIKQGEINRNGEIDFNAFEKMKEEQYLYKTKNCFSLLQEFNKNSGRIVFGPGNGNDENDEIAGLIVDSDGTAVYTYSQAYGINSNANNKVTAWEFIKFLASEEMQTSLKLMGLPVNNKARFEKAKQNIAFDPENNSISAELTAEQSEVLNQYTATEEKYSDRLNTYFLQDTTIINMMDAELANFFNGSKTSEEVAALLQNKIQMYLNE